MILNFMNLNACMLLVSTDLGKVNLIMYKQIEESVDATQETKHYRNKS